MGEEARFVGFTSGCGGTGTTSAALAFGRSLSRLNGKNVLYISFDFLCSKCFGDGHARRKDLYDVIVCGGDSKVLENDVIVDAFGLKYLSFNELINPLHLDFKQLDFLLSTLSVHYDVVVLDIPSNCMMSAQVLPYCEDIIVVYGYNQAGYRHCDSQCEYASQLCLDSRQYKLFTSYDENSFDNGVVDIHGEFGAKVREIATQIGF